MRHTVKKLNKNSGQHQHGSGVISKIRRGLQRLRAYPKKLIPLKLRQRFRPNIDFELEKISATLSIDIDAYSEIVTSKLKYLTTANRYIGNVVQRYLFYIVNCI